MSSPFAICYDNRKRSVQALNKRSVKSEIPSICFSIQEEKAATAASTRQIIKTSNFPKEILVSKRGVLEQPDNVHIKRDLILLETLAL